ncbi:MAG TPA: hypothetical protein VLJ39_12370 [Tepidisphaeraceae bacterium]|nr:hypothetical protein [Tepidisphaeraceae bacterium]
MSSRHRNNAAEWVLWAVLLPAVPVVWVITRILRTSQCHSSSPDRRE